MNYKIFFILLGLLWSNSIVAQTNISLNAGVNHSKFRNTQDFGHSTFQSSGIISILFKNEPSIILTDNFSLSWNFGVIIENRRTMIEISKVYSLNSFDFSFPVYLSFETVGFNFGLGGYLSLPFVRKINSLSLSKYPEGSVEDQLYKKIDYGIYLSAIYNIPSSKINVFFNIRSSFNSFGANYVKVNNFGILSEKTKSGFGLDILSYGLGYNF